MHKYEKEQLMQVVLKQLCESTYKKIAERYNLEYTDKANLFDDLTKLSKTLQIHECPWTLVEADGTLEVYMLLPDANLLLAKYNEIHQVIAVVLNTLIEQNKLVIYDRALQLRKDFELPINSKYRNTCPLIIDYIQNNIASLAGFTTKNSTCFEIKSGPCIRLKKSGLSFGMASIDNVPNENYGLVYKNHYLLNVIGFNDSITSFNYKGKVLDITSAKSTYRLLTKYDTLLPASCSWLEYCCMSCLGFKCALYTKNFKVFTIKKKELCTFHVEGSEQKTHTASTVTKKSDASHPNLHIYGVDYKYIDGRYVPFLFEPNDVIYAGAVVDHQTNITDQMFVTIHDPGKYISIGNKLSTRMEVYTFLRDNKLFPGAYTEGIDYGDLDMWQVAAEKASLCNFCKVDRPTRLKGFKARIELLCSIFKVCRCRHLINEKVNEYTGPKYTFSEAKDAPYIALYNLYCEGVVPKEFIEMNVFDIGSRAALTHAAYEENVRTTYVDLDDYEEYSLVNSKSVIAYLKKHSEDTDIQMLYNSLQYSYTDDCCCVRIAP